LSSWQRLSGLPGASPTNRVSEFGQTSSGAYAALLANGSALSSIDGREWALLAVSTTQAAQDVVVRHTVSQGDTVWAISRANGVSVSAIVTENALSRGGASIRIGQTLTMTKRGVVTTVTSPVVLDPSIVISSGTAGPVAPTTEAETPATPAPDSTPDGDGASGGSEGPETPSESEPVTEEPAVELPPLEPLVTQTTTNDVVYTVVRGDTLMRIAFRNTTTVSKLVSDNAIKNRNRISLGQRLKVGTIQQAMTYHRAQVGDTPERIAERRSVAMATVLSLNTSLRSGQTIEAGQLVRLS
jgi:LysM repeat protein